MRGIDTSKWQNSQVDYAKAKACGYDFVILRIGAEGVGTGNGKDKTFDVDFDKAFDAGLKIGVYYYSCARSIQEAEEDARSVIQYLGNRRLSLPIAYDMEDACQKGAEKKYLNSQIYNAFANVLKAKGYRTMLYTGEYFYNTYFDHDMIKDPLWIANYTRKPKVDCVMWQYTSKADANDFYKHPLDRSELLVDYNKLMGQYPIVPITTYTNTAFVIDVQKAIGAGVDGIVGTETISKTPTISMTKNPTHPVVLAVQKRLREKKWCVGASGKFDKQTENVVKGFQTKFDCVSDGELTAGQKTWQTILKY